MHPVERWRLLIAGLVMSSAVACGGPAGTHRLEFVGASGTALGSVSALRGMSLAAVGPELGEARHVCLGDVAARYTRTGYPTEGTSDKPIEIRTEAHLYLRDPNEFHDTLTSLKDEDVLSGRWASETAAPSSRPNVLVMPFSPEPGFTLPSYQVPLGTLYYPAWGPGGASGAFVQAHPEGYQCRSVAAGTVGNGHAVRAAFLYDRGLCSSAVPMSEVIDATIAESTNKMREGLYKAGAVTLRRRYNIATSYTRAELGHVLGGIFWAFHVIANSETHIWGKMRLEFSLHRGIPTWTPREDSYGYSGGMGPSWGEWLRNGIVVNGSVVILPLAQELINGFEAKAISKLTLKGAMFGSDITCNVEAKPDELARTCARAAAKLAAFAIDDNPFARGPNSRALTTGEQDQFRCALGDDAACGRRGVNAESQRQGRWSCGHVKEESDVGSCDFIIPVKRLNPMPDRLELVFFDSRDEFDNAALAVSFRYGPTMCVPPEPVPDKLLDSTWKVLLRSAPSSTVTIDPWPS